MARRYLGDTFDIHGGGIDLRFPHHENEQAQSHAAGLGFARYWLHNAWVTVKGQKMGKSLGNSARGQPRRRGRHPTGGALLPLGRALPLDDRVSRGVPHRGARHGRTDRGVPRARRPDARPGGVNGVLPQAFRDAMDDDLNVSGALAVVHDTVVPATPLSTATTTRPTPPRPSWR